MAGRIFEPDKRLCVYHLVAQYFERQVQQVSILDDIQKNTLYLTMLKILCDFKEEKEYLIKNQNDRKQIDELCKYFDNTLMLFSVEPPSEESIESSQASHSGSENDSQGLESQASPPGSPVILPPPQYEDLFGSFVNNVPEFL
jgi:hypothetical protein